MENLNKYISSKMKILDSTSKSFEDVFNIMHDQDDRIFSEITDGYKIKETTYNEIKELCVKTGNYYKEKLRDLDKGSYVGLLMENSQLWVSSFWAILMAGYKPVLLNKRFSKELNEKVIKMTNISWIITDDKYDFDVDYIYPEIDQINKFESRGDFTWENEIALSTSATSLNVKVCLYDGAAICEQIMNTKKIVRANSMVKKHYKSRLKILAFLPFYHVFGLIATYFWFAFFGRTFVFLKDYSTSTILKTVRKHKVTHIFAVPMLWHGIHKEITKQVNSSDEATIKKFNKGLALSIKIQNIFPRLGKRIASKLFAQIQNKVFGDSIQFMISGGGYISDDANKLINAIGYPLYNGYGMSEIGITSVELRKKIQYRLEGTVGKPFDSVEYTIDENNVLLVKGKSLCKTIITENEIIQIDNSKWFNTSDITSRNQNGTYMIKGRKDDVVISTSGEKVNPDLIEKDIYISESIRHCVMGLDYDNKNALTLIIEVSEGLSVFGVKHLIEEVDASLMKLQKMNYFIERVCFTYDPIAAKTAVKVSRKILSEWINNGKVKLYDYNYIKSKANISDEELVDDISMQIKNIMAEVLSIDVSRISVKSHYIFDLGGSSLDYISLLMRLKENFGMDFNGVDSLYNAESIAKYIIEKNGEV